MANENLTLYVASYADGAAAEADFRALKEAEGRRTSRARRGRRQPRRCR